MLHGRRAECDALERLPGPQAAALGGALGLAPRRAWFLDPMGPLFED